MTIGIIGSGNIGATVARLFVQAGHDVAISNSRGPESLRDFTEELGEGARAVTIVDAALFGDVILNATPFGIYRTLPVPAFAGKIVIDASNYYPARDEQILLLDRGEATSSELLAAHLPGSVLVKAFNTLYFKTLAERNHLPEASRLVLPLAGNDNDAKRTVTQLILDAGFAPLDVGYLLGPGARAMEPDGPLYNLPLTLLAARAIVEKL